MAEKDEFFLPEEVDRQIESVSQFKEGDRIDAKALAYLRSFYQADAQQEQESLDRIWNRIASATFFEQDTQESEKELAMQNPHMQYGGRTIGSLAWITPTARFADAATRCIGGGCFPGSPGWQYGNSFLRGSTYSWRHCLSSSNINTYDCSCAIESHVCQYVGNTWIDCEHILRYELDRDLYGPLPRHSRIALAVLFISIIRSTMGADKPRQVSPSILERLLNLTHLHGVARCLLTIRTLNLAVSR